MNTLLEYLYRDAANYKRHGAFTFVGTPTEPLLERLRAALFDREFVVAAQVGLPSLAPWMLGEEPYDSSVDHALHEVVWPPSPTDEEPCEPTVTLESFVGRVEQASREGWDWEGVAQ
jgi:hypothetical protein